MDVLKQGCPVPGGPLSSMFLLSEVSESEMYY